MSVVAQTYACDWPGCTATVTVGRGLCDLSDRDWEGRGGFHHGKSQWHACPVHRFKTSREFRRAIEGAEAAKGDRP